MKVSGAQEPKVPKKTKRRIKLNIVKAAEQQYGIAPLPDDPVCAMAYVPFQGERSKTFSPDQGFALGTMYQALNKPFYGSKCGDSGD